MTLLTIILIFAATVVAIGVLAVLAWLVYAAWLTRVERELARRKGLYRETVAGLAQRVSANYWSRRSGNSPRCATSKRWKRCWRTGAWDDRAPQLAARHLRSAGPGR